MYRDGQQMLTNLEHRFILNHGALGDVLTSLPAIIHARQSVVDKMVLKVYCSAHQVPLLSHLLAPYGAFEVHDLLEIPNKREEREGWAGDASTSLNAPLKNTHTRNRVHMVDFAFAFLIDAKPESMAQRSYPTLAPLGPRVLDGRYVVFPVGATSDNKLFKAAVMGPVIEWAFNKGLLPVLVGSKVSRTFAQNGDGTTEALVIRDEVDKLEPQTRAVCIDLREKTTLLELRDLLGHAEAVVGVDGGTLHLAGTTDANIIYASGTTHPKHRYIARSGNPNHKIRYVGPRDLECSGCQSHWTMTRHDFRFCPYNDNRCMDNLHPDDFINGLKELGL